MSRSSLYELLARYRAEGDAAFEPRSRRPHTSPGPTLAGTVELVLAVRKQLSEAGLDAGAEEPGHQSRQRKGLHNSRQPVDDVANYLAPWSKLLRSNGYPPEKAAVAAMLMLPDVLRYDRSKPVAHPNGRGLTDDVCSWRHACRTHDRVGSQGIGPHTDLSNAFPYLGLPNS